VDDSGLTARATFLPTRFSGETVTQLMSVLEPDGRRGRRAVQLLRYKRIRVFDLDDWSRRTEIERNRETEGKGESEIEAN
jgi:hypothetical protein